MSVEVVIVPKGDLLGWHLLGVKVLIVFVKRDAIFTSCSPICVDRLTQVSRSGCRATLFKQRLRNDSGSIHEVDAMSG